MEDVGGRSGATEGAAWREHRHRGQKRARRAGGTAKRGVQRRAGERAHRRETGHAGGDELGGHGRSGHIYAALHRRDKASLGVGSFPDISPTRRVAVHARPLRGEQAGEKRGTQDPSKKGPTQT